MTTKLEAIPSTQIYTYSISRSIWASSLKQKDHFLFLHRMLTETLDSLKQKSYTNFDAQTTSNCCHGLSVLVRRLILALLPQLDHLSSLLASLDSLDPSFLDNLPDELIDLTSIYVLTLIVELDPQKGRRSSPRNLKSKGHLGTAFCRLIVKELQKSFSIYVAENYINLSLFSENSEWISDTKLSDWRKYLEKDYIRTDKRGVKYASALFSMQICLHYLSETNATVALACDFLDPDSKTLKARYIRLFRNKGNKKLTPIEFSQDVAFDEPIFVLGGYAYDKNHTTQQLENKLEPWIYQLPALILSCDLYYPEFPKVNDDPGFDSTRIYPKESSILEIFKKLKKITGFSADKPSRFCLSHIFLSSWKSLVDAQQNSHSSNFPDCYIPSPSETIA